MKKIIMIVLLTQVIFARDSKPVTIERIWTYAEVAVLRLSNDTVEKNNCVRKNYIAIRFNNAKEMYSAALAAFMSDKKIVFGYSSDTCDNVWSLNGMSKVYRIDVLK